MRRPPQFSGSRATGGIHRSTLLVAIAVLSSACGFDGVTVTPRPAAQAVDVTLILRSDSLSEAAALLGWGDAIPEVDLTIQRVGLATDPPPIPARTDAQGVVHLGSLQTGEYRVTVERPLTLEEFEQVRETGVTGIYGSLGISVTATAVEFELAPAPALRRPLVISEYHFMGYYTLGLGQYSTGGFLELYNNSDTTIYLDGKLVGRGMDLVSTSTPCDWTAPFRTDPAGVWAVELQQFPGSGVQYPLEPGETVVIATDAIDHREFVPELLDLSGADFEFSGPKGPDNPAVPNMIDVGDFTNQFGHGIVFSVLAGIPFVADPVDLDAVARGRILETITWDMHRIPTERVLDIAAFYSLFPYPGREMCPPLVHPGLVRREGTQLPFENEPWLRSLQRKVALRLADGRAILQDTRDSGVDFFLAGPTPGSPPTDGF